MLCIGDFKQLEFNAAAFLSQDRIALSELSEEGYDIHANNQKVLGLPSRLIAKVFQFRLLYGGTADSYANDPDFFGVSTQKKYWQQVIEKFYEKYQGIAQWHQALVEEAMMTGRVVIPTGRFYSFKPRRNRIGELEWPRTTILNYPVQGMGAELMVLARILMKRMMQKENVKSLFVGTVHDSTITDGPADEKEVMYRIFKEAWERIPGMFEKVYGIPYNVPCKVEVVSGKNWAEVQ